MVGFVKDWPRDAEDTSKTWSSFTNDCLQLAKNKTYLLIVLAYGLCNAVISSFMYWGPHLIQNVLTLRLEDGSATELENNGFNLEVYWMLQIITPLLIGCGAGGYLCHKFADKSFYANALICCIPALIGLVLWELALWLYNDYFFMAATPLQFTGLCLLSILFPGLKHYLMVSKVPWPLLYLYVLVKYQQIAVSSETFKAGFGSCWLNFNSSFLGWWHLSLPYWHAFRLPPWHLWRIRINK